jgi:1,4-alpha-glucan branching enzyme
MPTISAFDLHLWGQGRLFEAHHTFGAHPNRAGSWFRVWAPRADSVSVIGDFNGWDASKHVMKPIGEGDSRLWELFVRGAKAGQHYKFSIQRGRKRFDKTDPFAREMEPPAYGGSALEGLSAIISDASFDWDDADWMQRRKGPASLSEAVSIYEVHLGSWRRTENGEFLGYRDLAKPLADYVLEMGFSHVELLPVQEHPFYGSWGYQTVGAFAPTFRYGHPSDFKFLVDHLHSCGIGVILDWVPAHFATDPQGLCSFDGEPLFEYTDPVMRHHPDWGTLVFDYSRPQVQNYLISNALYWLEEFHIDGLRFDAVASMLYRDYSRKKWTPNREGGRENLEAVAFLKQINETVFASFQNAMMIAEESTAWPGVSHPTYAGGLGFLYKWNMGWMHDTFQFFREDPLHRKYHYHGFTFPLVYAWAENYVLSLSHDEVVHGKGSLFGKMPGDDWQKAANVRLLFAHQFGHPGKKLIFMGMEFGQGREWSHDRGLDWWLLDADAGSKQPTARGLHSGIQAWVRELNALYKNQASLKNESPQGFEWIDYQDTENTTAAYIRQEGDEKLAFVFNFTPVPRPTYELGLPTGGKWKVLLNSDEARFGGSGTGSSGSIAAVKKSMHGRPFQAALDLPPLGVLVLRNA